jgi:hypothetical protein
VLISQIRQLGVMTDAARFESVAQQKNRLTPDEWALWQQIQGDAPIKP